jgi:hypothetical protein
MGQAIPTQHPAVVLRSHYVHLRASLAIAMIAVISLSAVVILATSEDSDTVAGSAAPVIASAPNGATRYDGGPEEGTRGALSFSRPASHTAATRYDGGPEEGSRGAGR